ncbi:hypothetical protein RFI_23583 [Reticulomyxa filosa]|uniref:Uncharacterized protein n=1 Tax=Reticulomyxa filosa TaxID=46433 RepID=X6MK02_RETFI|nr:hypothetical protein RFI_23583 [Reticulomyxa filosa]|eukprot:ETO13787.1 hypothetical protein RFI_23583 [Reticulomyxa filosa]
MYAFHVKEKISTEMMELLIPEQFRNDPSFWEMKDKRGSSLLLFAIWNSKPYCTARLRTLRQYMPDESFQKLIVCSFLSFFICFVFVFFFLSYGCDVSRLPIDYTLQQEPKPLLYAFFFQERVDDELMRMLIPTERESAASFWRAKDQVLIYVYVLLFINVYNRNSVIQIAILNKRPECLQRLNMLKKHMAREYWLDLLQNKNSKKSKCVKYVLQCDVKDGDDAWELTKKQYANDPDNANDILTFLTKST